MLRNTAATSSASKPIRHATTASDVSALAQTAASQPLGTGQKVKGLSNETLQAIQEIADKSIQNKERIDSLMHSINLLGVLKNEAFHEKEKHIEHENLRKKDLEKDIKSIKEKEKKIRDEISNVSEEIQFLEKKQEKKDRLAAEREAVFKTNLAKYKEISERIKGLEERNVSLGENHLILQKDIGEKDGDIKSLEKKMASVDASIKKLLEGQVEEAYEEMMQTSASMLKKHGKPFLSEITIGELTNYLNKMTDHPRSKSEQIKQVQNKYKLIKYATYMAAFASSPLITFSVFKALEPFERELERLRGKQGGSLHEQIRLNEKYDLVNAAYNKRRSQMMAIMPMAIVLMLLCMVAAVSLQRKLEKKATDKIKGENEPLQRTLKRGVIDQILHPGKSAEEELFKFAFGLVQHANIKLFKSPLRTMAKEVTRLVMEARNKDEASINVDEDYSKSIQGYLHQFKHDLKKEKDGLEKWFDDEIKKVIKDIEKKAKSKKSKHVEGSKKKESYLTDFLSSRDHEQKSLSEKADFLRAYKADEKTEKQIDDEVKKICEMEDKAKFIHEFSKVLNGNNEGMLANAIKSITVGLAEEIIHKLSAADAEMPKSEASSSSGSFFERSVKDEEQEKQTLRKTLTKIREEIKEIVQENQKIEKNIEEVGKEIREKRTDLINLKMAMTKIPLRENKLPEYKQDLSDAGIDVELQSEDAEFTAKKNKNIKMQQEEEERKLAELLKYQDELYFQYSEIQSDKNKKENQLETIEFMEKNKPDRDEKIKNIENDIEKNKKEIDKLKLEEKKLLDSLSGVNKNLLEQIMTPNAIQRVKSKHLDQSEESLKRHAVRYGYSSNYRSVGHFLRACLDTHASFLKKIDESGVPELQGYFAKSDMDVADGMDWKYQNKPISASVSDIVEKSDQEGTKYLINHIYGYVPRGSHITK